MTRWMLWFLALVSVGSFAALHLLGWRADTAFLSGNTLDPEVVGRGSAYALVWLQAVVLAPVLALGGAVAGRDAVTR